MIRPRDEVPRPLAALALSLAIALSPALASATVMVELPLEALTHQSDAIVVATVISSRAQLVIDPVRGSEVHTFSELRVLESLAGPRVDRIVVEEIGGTLQGETLHIEGTPHYAIGGEVVAFLERRADGSFRTTGMAQGRFEIRRGVAGAPDSVAQDLDGIAFARWQGGTMTVGHPADRRVELQAFLATVRALIASPAPHPGPTAGPGAVR